jgi:hypothetical protein
MSEDTEYRGVSITIPRTDDGAWRWEANYKRRGRYLPVPFTVPRPAYKTHDDAVAGAKQAIDDFLKRRDPHEIPQDAADR